MTLTFQITNNNNIHLDNICVPLLTITRLSDMTSLIKGHLLYGIVSKPEGDGGPKHTLSSTTLSLQGLREF